MGRAVYDPNRVHRRWLATWRPWGNGRQTGWALGLANAQNRVLDREELRAVLRLLYHRQGCHALSPSKPGRWTKRKRKV